MGNKNRKVKTKHEDTLALARDILGYRGKGIESLESLIRDGLLLAKSIKDKENEFWLQIELYGIDKYRLENSDEISECPDEFHKAFVKHSTRVRDVRNRELEIEKFENAKIPEEFIGKEDELKTDTDKLLGILVNLEVRSLLREYNNTYPAFNEPGLTQNDLKYLLASTIILYIDDIYTNIKNRVFDIAEDVIADNAIKYNELEEYKKSVRLKLFFSPLGWMTGAFSLLERFVDWVYESRFKKWAVFVGLLGGVCSIIVTIWAIIELITRYS